MNLNLTSTDFSKQIDSKIFGSNSSFNINHILYDTRKISEVEGAVFFALQGELRDGHQFVNQAYDLGIRVFVVEYNFKQIKQDAQYHFVTSPLKSLQKLAKHHREKFDYPVIAITGSAGKTTVKEWLYHLLSDHFSIVRSPKSYNSQLGVALSLLEMNEKHNLALIEAGISAPGDMLPLEDMIHPSVGIFTSLGSAHAQNFSSKEKHQEEKTSLFKHCVKVFVSKDIPQLSINNYEIVDDETELELLNLCPFDDLISRKNLCLCIALAKYLKIPEAVLKKLIPTLPRLALRMETFEGINNNFIINDSYNADLDALQQSLEYQKSISKNKLRTVIIGTDGLSEEQIKKIKHLIKSFNVYQSFYLNSHEIFPIEEIQNQILLIKGSRKSNTQRIVQQFQLKKHKTRIEIDLRAIKHNLLYLQSLTPETCKSLVMVKASSYGSGGEKMGRFLEKLGVDYLGVAYVDEGVELRKNGVQVPIIVMNPDEDSFYDLIDYNLEPSLYSFSILEDFTKILIQKNLSNYPVHLKIDTGMKRLGFESEQVQKLIQFIKAQPELNIKSIFSHLVESDNFEDTSFSEKQIAQFSTLAEQIASEFPYKIMKHLCNSEGIPRFTNAHFDMVRIGIALYGISNNPMLKDKLIEAISWKSHITQIKNIQKGDSVGYSRAFIAKQDMKIAVIPVGYADGLSRSLSNGKINLFVNHNSCSIIGNICMDMCMIDVSKVSCKEGDLVEIIGENQSIVDLAKKMNTIPYEVLTSFSKRLNRIYIEES